MKKISLKLKNTKKDIFLSDGTISLHFGRSLDNIIRFVKAGLTAFEEAQSKSKYNGIGYDFMEKDVRGGEIHFEYNFGKKSAKISYKAVIKNNKEEEIVKKEKVIKLDVFNYSFNGNCRDILNWYDDLIADTHSFVQKNIKGSKIKDKELRNDVYSEISKLHEYRNSLYDKYGKL